jgi:ubiquinone/menaquinone biosynthesis C-methylase UbiE
MDFYTSITEYYNYIFPLNKTQVEFVRNSFKETRNLSLLDIGFGTGNLTLELSKIFKEVTGIDLDKTMLSKAEKNISESVRNLKFMNLDMLKIDATFGDNTFDVIVCFGNTLVHLDSEEYILDFFIKTRRVLSDGGKLLFQIINYDRIIDKGINGLPTIENEIIKFERNYTYHKERNVIDFETILTIKENTRQISNKIELYPIRKSQIAKLLFKAGFTDIRYFGNFKREELTSENIPLVVETLK